MKTFISKFGVGFFSLCCLLVVFAGILVFGGDSYKLGKASVTPQLEQTNNEFTLKIQQLQLDIAEKQKQNTQLQSQINSYSDEINNLTEENTSLQSQVETLTIERDNAIASGSTSQEQIDNLNTQINTLNTTIEQNELTIIEKNSEITTLNATIEENSILIDKLSSRALKFSTIVDKTVTEVTAEDLEGITKIGDYAFYECNKLRSITFPSTITSIGKYAFYNAHDSLHRYSIDLSHCTNLTSIGEYSFYGCFANSIEFPSSLTTIGEYAFNGQYVTEIDLRHCTSLTSINDYTFINSKELTSIYFPSSLVSLGDYVFQSCTKLSYVNFEECINLRSIGMGCFRDESLITANLSSTRLSTVGYGAFMGCKKLTSVVLPNSVTKINQHAFRDCTSLTSIVIPESIIEIGQSAFSSCEKLRIVDFSNCTNFTKISSDIFYKCWSLIEVIGFEDCVGLTSIPSSCFYNCYSLSRIVIPENVTTIGNNAFGSCSSLVEIYNLSSMDIQLSSYMYGAYNVKAVHTTLESESVLLEEDGLLYSFNDDGTYTLIGLKDLTKTSVTIDANTSVISCCAFTGVNLTDITILCTTIPSLIKNSNIGSLYAFKDCSATLHVCGVDEYRSATNWKDLTNEFVEIETTTEG